MSGTHTEAVHDESGRLPGEPEALRLRIGLDVTLGARISRGGGASSAIVEATTGRGGSFAFKRYRATHRPDEDALLAMVRWRRELPPDVRVHLDATGAFPLALVEEEAQVVGMLMQRAPAKFVRRPPRPATAAKTAPASVLGGERGGRLAHADLLGASRGRAGARGDFYWEPPHKLAVIAEVITKLEFLHGLGVVVGDLQPMNLLVVPRESTIDCWFLDCDSMLLHGRSILPTMDPEAWRVSSTAEFNAAGDLRKTMLLLARSLAEDMAWIRTPRSIAQLPLAEVMTSSARRYVEDILTEDPGADPTRLRQVTRTWRSLARPNRPLVVVTDRGVTPWVPQTGPSHQDDPDTPVATSDPDTLIAPAAPKPAASNWRVDTVQGMVLLLLAALLCVVIVLLVR